MSTAGDGGRPFLPGPGRPDTRRAIIWELVIVFLVTLGASGMRSLLSLIDKALKDQPLSSQVATIVAPQATLGWIDLAKQLLNVGVGLSWGLLGLLLIYRSGLSIRDHMGLDGTQKGRDALRSVGLAALIGIPGLVFYIVAFRAGLNVEVRPTTLDDTWWSPVVLVLAAVENGFLEEVLVVGYLLTRLRQLNVSPWLAIAASAVLRGSYHLYQGYGAGVGNIVMGVVFALFWWHTRRLWPLILAHILIDIVAFVGYATLGDIVTDLLHG